MFSAKLKYVERSIKKAHLVILKFSSPQLSKNLVHLEIYLLLTCAAYDSKRTCWLDLKVLSEQEFSTQKA